ncbi:MAG: FAD:protein FMN transferase [Actinomyces sp.]
MAGSAGNAPTWRSSFPAMGTRVDIIGWGGDGMAIVNAIVGVVARHEDMWSAFRPSSEVSRLNAAVRDAAIGSGASRCGADSAQGGPGLVVSEETDRLLRDALALAEATGGVFNPLIGPLVAAWDVKAMRAAYVAGAPLPPAPCGHVVEAALRASAWGLLSRVGERRWAMGLPGEPVGGVDAPSPSLDLGGIAKGYSADACRDLAVAMGARGVLVSVGTSSVSVFGTRADGSSWRAGLRDPHGGPTSVAGVVELPVGGMASLSSSGDNLGPLGGVRVAGTGCAADPRARETSRETSRLGGRLLDHHIIDPRTGYPAHAGVRQVSVVASSGVLAEALSTALLVDPSLDVSDVVACWARVTGAPASAKVVGLVRARA